MTNLKALKQQKHSQISILHELDKDLIILLGVKEFHQKRFYELDRQIWDIENKIEVCRPAGKAPKRKTDAERAMEIALSLMTAKQRAEVTKKLGLKNE